METIDAFFERHETAGYKFDIDSEGNVFIVEMEGPEHTSVIELLIDYFKIPNGVEVNSVRKNPFGCLIFGCNQFYNLFTTSTPPRQRRFGCTVRPRLSQRHLEIPPVDKGGRPHARIMCEIAVSQSYADLKAKCERWMRQEYAMLWSPTPKQVTVARQPGVFVEEWNFGTIDYYNVLTTACAGPGLPNYQINIPVHNVFWNPPIVGVPNTARYVTAIPASPNFTIDLFQIQQVVLQNQNN
ncbi:hypothetical protein Glove_593g20 [Diversispora epigaea]|uniref:Uncharacterized protein n=1 Tax=Diversispora epigaea TaxID=1348612 RepID=A0A397GAK8_9GLOM|nr:hypothetical protein Glove_593g20 [Diversispora epigaea]